MISIEELTAEARAFVSQHASSRSSDFTWGVGILAERVLGLPKEPVVTA